MSKKNDEPIHIFTVRLDAETYQWLKQQRAGMNQTVVDALKEKRYRQENQNPYSTGWRDGYEAGKKDKE